MITALLPLFILELAFPSYASFAAAVPENVIVEAMRTNAPSARAPIKKTESIAPVVQAKAIYAVDVETETPLLARNVFERRPIASIAKLMTAMVILDRHALTETVRVSRRAAEQEPTKMSLKPGEEITVENLLTGLLIGSANDAAVALAEFDAGNEESFVKRMNEKAQALGLTDSHFSNPKGFDEPQNYSTAGDTERFALAALGYPFIRQTVVRKTAEATSLNGNTKHRIESTNELLNNSHFAVIGLKTGKTPAAGQSFVSLTKAPSGHEILTVILDSPDRFRETKIVLDWILRNYDFR